MNTSEAATGEPREPVAEVAAENAELAAAAVADVSAAEAAPVEREPIVTQTEHEVVLVRSVRYGRIIVTGLIVGAGVAMILSLLTPVDPKGDYSMGQIVGFMALIGGVIGLAAAGILSIVLGAVAKRRSGTGIAIQTDVR